jgi:hypothetical protein
MKPEIIYLKTGALFDPKLLAILHATKGIFLNHISTEGNKT